MRAPGVIADRCGIQFIQSSCPVKSPLRTLAALAHTGTRSFLRACAFPHTQRHALTQTTRMRRAPGRSAKIWSQYYFDWEVRPTYNVPMTEGFATYCTKAMKKIQKVVGDKHPLSHRPTLILTSRGDDTLKSEETIKFADAVGQCLRRCAAGNTAAVVLHPAPTTACSSAQAALLV